MLRSVFLLLTLYYRSRPDVVEQYYPDLFKQFSPDELPSLGGCILIGEYWFEWGGERKLNYRAGAINLHIYVLYLNARFDRSSRSWTYGTGTQGGYARQAVENASRTPSPTAGSLLVRCSICSFFQGHLPYTT